MPVSTLPALFVLSGLVASAAHAAPVPSSEIAEAQLRAINHRFVSSTVDVSGDLMEILTHEDFLLTQSDGSWRDRAEFVAHMTRLNRGRAFYASPERLGQYVLVDFVNRRTKRVS